MGGFNSKSIIVTTIKKIEFSIPVVSFHRDAFNQLTFQKQVTSNRKRLDSPF